MVPAAGLLGNLGHGFEIDSMLSYSAHALGIVEELIPGRISVYRIAHEQSHDHRISVGNDRRSTFLLAIEAV